MRNRFWYLEYKKKKEIEMAKDFSAHISTTCDSYAAHEIKRHNGSKRYRDWETDRKSTRLNSSHSAKSRMPSSA